MKQAITQTLRLIVESLSASLPCLVRRALSDCKGGVTGQCRIFVSTSPDWRGRAKVIQAVWIRTASKHSTGPRMGLGGLLKFAREKTAGPRGEPDFNEMVGEFVAINPALRERIRIGGLKGGDSPTSELPCWARPCTRSGVNPLPPRADFARGGRGVGAVIFKAD